MTRNQVDDLLKSLLKSEDYQIEYQNVHYTLKNSAEEDRQISINEMIAQNYGLIYCLVKVAKELTDSISKIEESAKSLENLESLEEIIKNAVNEMEKRIVENIKSAIAMAFGDKRKIH